MADPLWRQLEAAREREAMSGYGPDVAAEVEPMYGGEKTILDPRTGRPVTIRTEGEPRIRTLEKPLAAAAAGGASYADQPESAYYAAKRASEQRGENVRNVARSMNVVSRAAGVPEFGISAPGEQPPEAGIPPLKTPEQIRAEARPAAMGQAGPSRRKMLPRHLQGRYGGRYWESDFEAKERAKIEALQKSHDDLDAKFESDKQHLRDVLMGKVPGEELTPEQYQRALDGLQSDLKTNKQALSKQIVTSSRNLEEALEGKRIAEARSGANVLQEQGRQGAEQELHRAADFKIVGSREEQLALLAEERQDLERKDAEAYKMRMEAFEEGREKLRQDMREADQRVLEYRIGDKRSAGQRAAEAIIAMLGAAGAIMTKSPNWAAKQLERNADLRIKSQAEELKSLRDKASQSRNDLAAYYTQFQDMEQAQLALKAKYIQEMAAKGDEIALQANSAQAKNWMMASMAKARGIMPLIYEQMESAAAQSQLQQQILFLRGREAAKKKEIEEARRRPGFDVPVSLVSIPKAMYDSYSPELDGFVKVSGEARVRVARSLAELKNARDVFGGMLRVMQENGQAWVPGSEARGKWAVLKDAALAMNSVNRGQGAVTQADYENSAEAYGAADKLFSRNQVTRAQIETQLNLTNNMIRNAEQAYGVTYGAPAGTGQDEKGNVVFNAYLVNPTEEQTTKRVQRAVNAARQER